MIPIITVVLLLVIFFVIEIVFIRKELKIQLKWLKEIDKVLIESIKITDMQWQIIRSVLPIKEWQTVTLDQDKKEYLVLWVICHEWEIFYKIEEIKCGKKETIFSTKEHLEIIS